MPTNPTAIIPDLDMTVLDAYRLARDNSMYLTIIAPYIPPGWREIPIRIKQRAANQPDGSITCSYYRPHGAHITRATVWPAETLK